jgi:hypothetical protein
MGATKAFSTSLGTAAEASNALSSLQGALESVMNMSASPSPGLSNELSTFAEASLDIAGSALESYGAAIGADVLELMDRVAEAVHALLPTASNAYGNAGVSSVLISTPTITLAVLSSSPMPPPRPITNSAANGNNREPASSSRMVEVPLELRGPGQIR